jgi:roadblock/LC7 domain-containing protein
MQPLKAQVKNGRLVLDAPTDLPEGELVELVPLDEVLAAGGDYLDDEERAALHDSLRDSVAQMKAGKLIDAAQALAELRAHS